MNENNMDKEIKVQGKYLTKRYEMAPNRSDKVKSLFVNQHFANFWALRGIDFAAYEGESVAIIGTNGSGKSTLMNIISNIIPATTGDFSVNGVVSLIAVQTGLRGGLSGRENIRLKGLMMGMSEKQIEANMQDIIDFSELGAFIDQPVKNYSSGMRSKLGFSISVHSDPDILIVDEALSVGDATFTRKSLDKIKEFQKLGKTIFFVSHSLVQVREMADRVLWIERGEIKMYGETEPVLAAYDAFVKKSKEATLVERRDQQITARVEQENFNLNELYANEAMAAGDVSDDAYADIYEETHHLNGPKKMSIWEKLFLTVLILILFVVGDAAILDMSAKQVMQNPAALVTSWSVSGIKDLNETHQNYTTTGVEVVKYTVKPGDTLDAVAKKYHVKPETIMRESDLKNKTIHPKQVLKIPKGEGK